MTKLIKYAMTGGSAFIIEFILYARLLRSMGYIYANMTVYTVMFWFVFLVNKYWTFGQRAHFGKQLESYAVLYVLNFFITNSLLYVLVSVFAADKYIAKVAVSAVAVLWNFILYQKAVFSPNGYR